MLVLVSWEVCVRLTICFRCGHVGGSPLNRSGMKEGRVIKPVSVSLAPDPTTGVRSSRHGWQQSLAQSFGPCLSPASSHKLSSGVGTKTHFWVQDKTAFRLELPPQEPELESIHETIPAENANKLPPHASCLLLLLPFFSRRLPRNKLQSSGNPPCFVENLLLRVYAHV